MRSPCRLVMLACCLLAVGCEKFWPGEKGPRTTPKKSQEEARESPPEQAPVQPRYDPREARRHREPAGGFSYIPPKDWFVRSFSGSKYKIVHTETVDKFTSNINLGDEIKRGSAEEYARQLPLCDVGVTV